MAPTSGGDNYFRGGENGVGRAHLTTTARPAAAAAASSHDAGTTPIRRKRTTQSHAGAGGAMRGGGGVGGGGRSEGSSSPGENGPALERTAATGFASASMAGLRTAGAGYHAPSPATNREGGDRARLLHGAGGPGLPSAAVPSTSFDRRARQGFEGHTGSTCWSPSPSSQEGAGGGNDTDEKQRQHHQPAAWAHSGGGGRGVDDKRAMANREAARTTVAGPAAWRARSSGKTHHSSGASSTVISPAVSAAVAAVSADIIFRERALATSGPIFEASAPGGSVQHGATARGMGQERHAIFQQQRGKQPITAADFHNHTPAIFSPPVPNALSAAASSHAAPVSPPTITAGSVEGGNSSSLSEPPPPSPFSAYPRGRPNLTWPHGAVHSGGGSVSRGNLAYTTRPSTAESAALRGVGSKALPEGPSMGLGLESDSSPGFGVIGHTGGGGGEGV